MNLADELQYMAEHSKTFEPTMATRKLLLRAADAFRQYEIDKQTAIFCFEEKCKHFREEREDLIKDVLAIKREIEPLINALQLLHDNHMEYLTINKLGGENNSAMKLAREALSKFKPAHNH